MDFYDKFLALCKENNVSPSRAAIEMDMNKGTVSVWKSKSEKGEEVTPSSPVINKIADYFHVSTDYLLGKTEHPNDYVLSPENYPNVLKPLVKENGIPMVLSVDPAIGYLAPEELAQLLIEEMKKSPVRFDANNKNSITEMMSLLPDAIRDNQMSLYDVVQYVSNSPEIMAKLKESGYNERGELTIPPDAFESAKEKASGSKDGSSNATILEDARLVRFPIIGSISAGYCSLADEVYTGDFELIPLSDLHGSPDDYFVLRVKGDSMYPRVLDGDRVFVRRASTVENGKIAVVLYNGDEATIKKVNYDNGKVIELIPYNPEYQIKRIEGADLEQCHILGEVIQLVRSL